MSGLFTALLGAAAQGVLWGIMVLGVYITYKLLDIADLTVDGSFALGGCVCAVMILNFIWILCWPLLWRLLPAWRQEQLPVFSILYLKFRRFWREFLPRSGYGL